MPDRTQRDKPTIAELLAVLDRVYVFLNQSFVGVEDILFLHDDWGEEIVHLQKSDLIGLYHIEEVLKCVHRFWGTARKKHLPEVCTTSPFDAYEVRCSRQRNSEQLCMSCGEVYEADEFAVDEEQPTGRSLVCKYCRKLEATKKAAVTRNKNFSHPPPEEVKPRIGAKGSPYGRNERPAKFPSHLKGYEER